jgi:hypothetical protein
VYLELTQPVLPFVRFLLAESKLDQFFISFHSGSERNHVFSHITEVFSSILVLARSKTLKTESVTM